MEWEYCKIKITINSELAKSKEIIDNELKTYYLFTQKDMDKLMSKLDSREKDLIRSLYMELEEHKESAYCEQGVNTGNWKWNWDFNK